MNPRMLRTLKTTILLTLGFAGLLAAPKKTSTGSTTLYVPSSLTSSSSSTTTASGTNPHFIQVYGPQASSKTFMTDQSLYSGTWPFFEGRSVEFNGSFVFRKTAMTDTQFATDVQRVKGFYSSTLSQNYVRSLSSAQFTEGNPGATWDLWKDSDRDAVVANFVVLARQARLVGFKGLFFDPEPYATYGYNPWQYSNHQAPAWSKTATGTWVNAHTFADTQARMQDLGARVMSAIEADSPRTKLLLAQGLGLLNDLCYGSSGQALTAVNAQTWSNHAYGLYASFIAGLASKVYNTRIVDMQENVGYWATCEGDLKNGASFVYTLGPSLLLPASVVPAYRSYIHWGYMIYTDALFRLCGDKRYLSGWMLASERPVFAATLAYWALKNASARGGADAEVMIYSETSMWGTNWAGTTVGYPSSSSIPNAYATALSNFRRGLAPADVTAIVNNAWARMSNGQWPTN